WIAALTLQHAGLAASAHPCPPESYHAIAVDVALGKVDYLEVVGFSDHRTTADTWYRLLNLGFKISAGAGTDAMMNYASLRGPVGTNRTYVSMPVGPIDPDKYFAGLKAGRTFVPNGPLVHLPLGGKTPGEEVIQGDLTAKIGFTASLRSIVPIEHLEIVCNGKVVKNLTSAIKNNVADVSGTLDISGTGWCLLRAWNEKPTYPILDV